MAESHYIDLLDLQTLLREDLEEAFPSLLWVRAEISSVKARRGSHCYLELSQSDEDGTLLAKVKAIIWAGKYAALSAYFASVAGGEMQEGMTLLFQVRVNYSELYGLSLIVNDIDASVMLGAQEEARQKTLARLQKEGRFETQKALALPALPYRIAVISAEDAAGYRDFMRHLHENEYGFVFETVLFPALMQGPQAPASMIAALSEAAGSSSVAAASCSSPAPDATPAPDAPHSPAPFDLVVILRGGGSKLDLACFDDYDLAVAIADCPLPVLTAVGHDQDFHICDQVAYDYVKTPTALADWLLDIYQQEDEHISSYVSRLVMAFNNKIARMESRIELLETRILSADPRNILKRGYVLALDADGRVMKKMGTLSPGDSVSVLFPDGRAQCRVVETVSENDKP